MGNGIFSGSKPIAGALLACVPLVATGTTPVSAWVNTNLSGSNEREVLENMDDNFSSDSRKENLENTDGDYSSDSLVDILNAGVNGAIDYKKLEDEVSKAVELASENNALGDFSSGFLADFLKSGGNGAIDRKKFEDEVRKTIKLVSENNVLGDVSEFETSNDKVILSATQSDSEKVELASSFLEAKKLGLYDVDWTVDPMSEIYGGATANKPEKDRLADVFGSMGRIAQNFAMTKFLTIKDKASNEVLGQITLVPDPLRKGNVGISDAWAKDENKLVNALNLVFKALSKNESVNKVLVTLSGGSGKKIESVLKKVSEGKSERFRKLTIVENINFVELTERKVDGRYIFRKGTLKKVNGKSFEPENLEEMEISEDKIEGAKKSINLVNIFPPNLLPTEFVGNSLINPETEEVIHSFVLKTTDYEFSE